MNIQVVSKIFITRVTEQTFIIPRKINWPNRRNGMHQFGFTLCNKIIGQYFSCIHGSGPGIQTEWLSISIITVGIVYKTWIYIK